MTAPFGRGPAAPRMSRSPPCWATLGETLASTRVRIQICGRITVEIDGRRREEALPGRQGRILLAYSVLHRHDLITRDELIFALWGDVPPRAVDSALGALLSKLRRA